MILGIVVLLLLLGLLAFMLRRNSPVNAAPPAPLIHPVAVSTKPALPKDAGPEPSEASCVDEDIVSLGIKYKIPLDIDIVSGDGSKCLADVIPTALSATLLHGKRNGRVITIHCKDIMLVLLGPPEPKDRLPDMKPVFLELLQSRKRRGSSIYEIASYLDSNECRPMVLAHASDPDPDVRKAVAKALPRLFRKTKRQALNTPFSFFDPSPDDVARGILDALVSDEDSAVRQEASAALETFNSSDQSRAAYELALQAKAEKKRRVV